MDNKKLRNDGGLKQTKSERNLPIILMRIIISLTVLIVILILALIFRPSTIEKEPYLVEFKTAQENYVVLQKAGADALSNKATVHRELKGYVEARENINKIDESRRYLNIVRAKSSAEVYQRFVDTFEAKNALWNTEGFSRECIVSNISDVVYSPVENKFIAIVEYSLIDKYADSTTTELFYKTTIEYEFVDHKISAEDLTLNPLGTNIIGYSISTVNKLEEDKK